MVYLSKEVSKYLVTDMLNYFGGQMALELGERAKSYLDIYAKAGAEYAFVPFRDLERGKKRWVKFQRMAGVDGWVYVDLVDKGE